MDLLAREFNLPDEGRDTPFIAECLLSITLGGGVDVRASMQTWSDLADFSERRGFFIHLGFSMGLAAQLTNFPFEQHDFAGVRFFEPLVISRTVHIQDGTLTEEECDVLEATIRPYKEANRKSGFEGKSIRHFRTRLRYLWIKVAGLRLLGSI